MLWEVRKEYAQIEKRYRKINEKYKKSNKNTEMSSRQTKQYTQPHDDRPQVRFQKLNENLNEFRY